MDNEFLVSLGVKFDESQFANLKKQIQGLSNNTVKIKFDNSEVKSQLSKIQKEIVGINDNKVLKNSVAKIDTKGIDEVNNAFKELISLQKEINSKNIKITSLDIKSNTQQIEVLKSQIKELETEYNNLDKTFSKRFSSKQIDSLIQEISNGEKKISEINAKKSDKSNSQQIKNEANEIKNAYRELINIQSKLNSDRTKIAGLNPEKDTQQIEVLRQEILKLSNDYNNLFETFGKSFSVTQLDTLNQKFETVNTKIDVLKAKSNDVSKLSFDKISMKFDDNVDRDVERVSSGLSKLREQTTETTSAYKSFQKAITNVELAKQSGGVEKLRNSYQEYNSALKEVNAQIRTNKRVEAENISADKLNQSKIDFAQKIDIWLKNNSAATKRFGGQLEALKAQIQSVDGVGLDNLKSQFNSITQQAELAGVATQTFGDRLSSQIGKLGTYSSAAAMFGTGVRAVKSMYQDVLSVDTAMTELYRVTNLTDKQYSNLYDNMVKSAKDYNAELSTIISSTASWVRLGFEENTANRLAEITAMYQHVTDLDEATAVENLVTAYKGYESQLLELTNGDSAKAVEMVADIFDKLGA